MFVVKIAFAATLLALVSAGDFIPSDSECALLKVKSEADKLLGNHKYDVKALWNKMVCGVDMTGMEILEVFLTILVILLIISIIIALIRCLCCA